MEDKYAVIIVICFYVVSKEKGLFASYIQQTQTKTAIIYNISMNHLCYLRLNKIECAII